MEKYGDIKRKKKKLFSELKRSTTARFFSRGLSWSMFVLEWGGGIQMEGVVRRNREKGFRFKKWTYY